MDELLAALAATALIPAAVAVAVEWVAFRREQRRHREREEARARDVAATIRADMHVPPAQLAIVGPNDVKRFIESSIEQRQTALERMEIEGQK